MDVTLRAEPRSQIGSPEARRLRRQGLLPGVVYGAGVEASIAVSVDRRELVAALTTEAGLNALITLEVDGDSHLTLAREIQRDAVRNEVIHVDFLAVRRDQAIGADIPLTVVGVAPAIRNELLVSQLLANIHVTALPGNIPGHIEVDVSGLATVTDSIRVGDLTLPEGVNLVTDPDEPVVVVTAPEAEELPVVEEEEEAEEGEEAAAEEGAAPPAAEAAEGEAGE